MANGLLDYYSNPQMMAALGIASGLLEAGGANPYPVGLGQGLGRGLLLGGQLGQSTANQQLRDAYLGSQTRYVDEQTRALQAQNNRPDLLSPIIAEFAKRLQAGNQQNQPAQNPMVPGHSGSSVMAGGPVASPSQQPPGGGFNMDEIDFLKLIGAPDFTSSYKARNPEIKWQDTGTELVPTHAITGQRIPGIAAIPKQMTPGESANFGQRQYEFGNLSATEAARQQVDRARLQYDTGVNLGAAPQAGPQPNAARLTHPPQLFNHPAGAQTPAAAPAASSPGLTPRAQAELNAKRAEDQPSAEKRMQTAQAKAQVVNGKVDEALKRLDDWKNLGTSGMRGALLGNVPGTDAYDLSQTLATIQANLGFGELQQMREASPTGGALGQVAVKELEFLQAAVASLKQGQDEKTLRDNLGAVKKHFNNWRDAVEQSYKKQYGGEQKAPAGWSITPVPQQR